MADANKESKPCDPAKIDEVKPHIKNKKRALAKKEPDFMLPEHEAKAKKAKTASKGEKRKREADKDEREKKVTKVFGPEKDNPDGDGVDDPAKERRMVQPKPWEPYLQNYLLEIVWHDVKAKYEMWPFAHYRIADFTIGVYGKRRTGKTTLAKDIVSQIKDQFRDVYLFTKTWFNGEWEGWIHPKRIIKGFNEGALQKIFENQEKIVSHNRQMFRQFKDEGAEFLSEVMINPYILIIFDDIVSDERFHDSDVLNNIAFQGRHLGIFAWVNAQDPYKVAPCFRGNFDIAFTFKQRQERSKECIRGEYLDFLIKKDSRLFLDRSTRDHNFIAIDTTQDEDPENSVYIGKANVIIDEVPLPYGGKEETRDKI